MTEAKHPTNGHVNWRTISIFFGLIVTLLAILNYANGRASNPTTTDHAALVTTVEYRTHVQWSDERYETLCERLDAIVETQKEILRELRNP